MEFLVKKAHVVKREAKVNQVHLESVVEKVTEAKKASKVFLA